MPTYNAEIYSPRWGHNDTYSFIFEQERLTIDFGARVANCACRENQDPIWTGEPFEDMLTNDSIYPPAILRDLIEHLWKSWRNGELRAVDVNTELQEVISWLNTVTAAKPKTDFWKKYF